MKENYEKKLKSLQNSIVHAQLERDEALKRIPNKNDNRDNVNFFLLLLLLLL